MKKIIISVLLFCSQAGFCRTTEPNAKETQTPFKCFPLSSKKCDPLTVDPAGPPVDLGKIKKIPQDDLVLDYDPTIPGHNKDNLIKRPEGLLVDLQDPTKVGDDSKPIERLDPMDTHGMTCREVCSPRITTQCYPVWEKGVHVRVCSQQTEQVCHRDCYDNDHPQA